MQVKLLAMSSTATRTSAGAVKEDARMSSSSSLHSKPGYNVDMSSQPRGTARGSARSALIGAERQLVLGLGRPTEDRGLAAGA